MPLEVSAYESLHAVQFFVARSDVPVAESYPRNLFNRMKK
jgi:hypothetical protein